MKNALMYLLEAILKKHGLESTERGRMLVSGAADMFDDLQQTVGQPGFEDMVKAIPTVLKWMAIRAAINEADEADKTTRVVVADLMTFGVSLLRKI